MFKSLLRLFALVGISFNLSAQITLSPTFVTQNDTVVVIFDATQGNGGLIGVSPIYAHTGVVTNLSSTPTSWRHVQGNWGTADPKVLMTDLGNNLHSIKYHINTFYGVPSNETVQSLAFVFRNVDGSKEGKTASGGDFFVPISAGGFQAVFTTPGSFGIYDVNDTLDLVAQASDSVDLKLFHGTTLLAQANTRTKIEYELPLVNYGAGRFDLILEATTPTATHYGTISYLARNGSRIAFDTSYFEEGITIINDSSIALKLRAPFKNFIYVIGDFNDWEIRPEYEMYKSPADEFFWLIIEDLDPAQEYAFQYYIDQEGLLVADAYSEKILDPWNDQYISSSVYPNLKSYPSETRFPVSVVQTVDPNPYQWASTGSYKKPRSEELVIYELLIRDFDSQHTYQSVIERLAYLQSLGVNAIELMPIMEFEGNESWGYNPMFFMAPDKYYGTKNDFKRLVDSCHARGIAVILDIAMNHAFGQCPFVRMYFDGSNPTSQSPWFNTQAKHDFNVGYDFNHTTDATKYFVKRVYQHWVEEYKVDGYRVDLSKGYTQKNTLGNTGLWGQYDQSRINILQRIKDDVNEVDSTAFMILEHFSDNNEELELSDRGFLLWGNENHEYNEASMGYASDFSSVLFSDRGWSKPNLVGYMESHDEERLMYKNLNFGKADASYSTRDTAIALDRMALDAAFFFTIPGPRMLWQFGELGYDYSINYCPNGTIDPSCRVSNKPIRWDYFNTSDRRDLHSEYSNLLYLRNSFPSVFQSTNISMSLSGFAKQITLDAGDSAAVVAGNFDVAANNMSIAFPESGWWYDYHSGDSIFVNGNLDTSFEAGEYHIYLNFKSRAPYNIGSREYSVIDSELSKASVFPNPSRGKVFLDLTMEQSEGVSIEIRNLHGAVLMQQHLGRLAKGNHVLALSSQTEALAKGVYIYKLAIDKETISGKIVLQ